MNTALADIQTTTFSAAQQNPKDAAAAAPTGTASKE